MQDGRARTRFILHSEWHKDAVSYASATVQHKKVKLQETRGGRRFGNHIGQSTFNRTDREMDRQGEASGCDVACPV